MTNPRDDLMALADYHEANCNRYVNGRCTTRRCLRRGGHKAGEQFGWDNLPSTCEEHETAVALRLAASRHAPVEPPGMTDLMVTPESLDAFMEANPLPDKPTTPDAVGEPVAASPYEGKMVVDARLLHALWCYGNLLTVAGVIYSPGSHQECLEQVNELFRERAQAVIRQLPTPERGK